MGLDLPFYIEKICLLDVLVIDILQGHIRNSLMTLGFFSSWFPCQHLTLCVVENSALYGPVRERIISTSCWLGAALLARHFHVHRGRARGHPSSIPLTSL